MNPFQLPAEDVPHLLSLCIVIVDALLPLLKEVHVVSAVDVDAAAVQFHDGVAHAVKEVAVVRYHEERAAAVPQMLLQELDGVCVQVVGGLVHDVEIGLGGKHFRKRHALDFAAGEVPHGLFHIREAELRQEPLHPSLILPVVLLVKVLCPLPGAVHDLPDDGFLRIKGILLLQKRNTDVLQEQHLSAAVRRVLPRQYPQQRSLPGAVRGDERHLVTLIYIEADALEQHLGAVGLGNVLNLKVTCHNGNKDSKIMRKFVPI